MRRLIAILLLAVLGSAQSFAVATRIKDLVMVAGARDNQLVGFGLVVGLAGDGDKDPVYTVQSVANMLQRFGISVPAATLSAKNVSAVMVTGSSRRPREMLSRSGINHLLVGPGPTQIVCALNRSL